MSTILIVEDEQKIARFLELELKHEGYDVIKAFDGRTGLQLALNSKPDLLVLDLMLPQLSGIEVCRRIRMESSLPIIMLTAKDDVSDKVMGLDMGADDYMTKPFAIEQLLARIRVALKKRAPAAPQDDALLTIGCISMNTRSFEIFIRGQNVPLTKKEFDLLQYFMRHPHEALSRDQLLTDVWGYEYVGDTNVVDVYVRYLRQKVDERYQLKTISTIRGVGYRFDYVDEKA